VSETVRSAIEASGLSGYALGQLAGVSRSVVCNFLDGSRSLTLETLDKIAPHIGLKVSYPARNKSR
jgi:transcriptional regulator with XRE-family HTH domain